MYTEIRWALVVAALALAALPVWLVSQTVRGNLVVLRSWRRAQGKVISLAYDDQVEIELNGEPDGDGVRLKAPIYHQIGLSFLKTVPIYVDPADAQHVRTGGLLQMWLMPVGLALVAAVLLSAGAMAANLGRGQVAQSDVATGSWMFSDAPAPQQADIRVYRPASEWKAPLGWSILGLALLACALFVRPASLLPRLGAGGAGMLFTLAMWGLAFQSKTTEVTADNSGMLTTSAFGWQRIRWEQVGGVAQEQTVFGRGEWILGRRDNSFPGRNIKIVVFRDKSGRQLATMSPGMEPRKNMRRLLDVCADRTGLRLEFRTIYDPDF